MNQTEKLEAVMRLAWLAFNQHDSSPVAEWAKGERARLLGALRTWQGKTDARRQRLDSARARRLSQTH